MCSASMIKYSTVPLYKISGKTGIWIQLRIFYTMEFYKGIICK